MVQNQHFLSSLTHLFAGLTAFSSDYITSWIAFRAPVARMHTKELNHAARRVVLELITTLHADGSGVIASHPTTRAALLVLPIFYINVTSRGCLATRKLTARHCFAAAARWRISFWPFVAVNEVFIRITFPSTCSGGPATDFSYMRRRICCRFRAISRHLKLVWKVTRIKSGEDGKGLSCPCLEGV